MIRGFLSGVFWGTVVAALGLGTVSQLMPLPVERISAEASTVERVTPAPVEPVAVPQAVAPVRDAPAPAVASEAKAVPATVPSAEVVDPPAGSEFAKPLPDVNPVAPAVDVAPAPDATTVAPVAPPVVDKTTPTGNPAPAPETAPDSPKPLEIPGESGDIGKSLIAEDSTKIALAVPDQLDVPKTDAAPVLVQDPAPPAKVVPDEAAVKPLPEILPVPDSQSDPATLFTPDPALVPQTVPAAKAEAKSSATLAPTPGLTGTVDGVTIGRLPRIGDVPPAKQGDEVPLAETNPDGSPKVVIGGEVDLPPLQKFARPFDNPDEKPLFSIVLIDTGGADLDRAALAAIPFPVTFALDPMAPNAADASKIYRSAGQEVIMVATGIPAGATASDLEVTFGSNAAALPEAVAVIDTETGSFQADSILATQVVPILKAQGRGMISWDRGLNVADQVARREGLPSWMVFRKLDGKGENKAAVRRALDRAAFKAVQDGRVMVIGQTLPETVAALLEWAVEGRATSLALAPVSAVLTTN